MCTGTRGIGADGQRGKREYRWFSRTGYKRSVDENMEVVVRGVEHAGLFKMERIFAVGIPPDCRHKMEMSIGQQEEVRGDKMYDVQEPHQATDS